MRIQEGTTFIDAQTGEPYRVIEANPALGDDKWRCEPVNPPVVVLRETGHSAGRPAGAKGGCETTINLREKGPGAVTYTWYSHPHWFNCSGAYIESCTQ